MFKAILLSLAFVSAGFIGFTGMNAADTPCDCTVLGLPECQFGCSVDWNCFDEACLEYTLACADMNEWVDECIAAGFPAGSCVSTGQQMLQRAVAVFNSRKQMCCDCE